MTLRQRWIAAAVVGVGLLLVVLVLLISRVVAVNSSTDKAGSLYEPASVEASVLRTSVSDMQRGLSAFLLTGDENDLLPYTEGARQSELAIASLERLLADDSAVQDVVESISVDREWWITNVAMPAISAKRAGDDATATSIYDDPEAIAVSNSMSDEVATLTAVIDQVRSASFDELSRLNTTLAFLIIGTVVVVLLGVAGTGVLLEYWVLRPLDQLRRQLQRVAAGQERNTPIEPSGPPDLVRVGQDAESMRRQLVAEIDEARSARQALDQRAPVVSAIRRELAAHAPDRLGQIQLAGQVSPAEGVLAGDWWDGIVVGRDVLAVMLTDVSGHGAAAGVAAMRVKHSMTYDTMRGRSMARAFEGGADALSGDEGRFATVTAFHIDTSTGLVRYANAGHHPMLLLSPEGDVRAELGPTGPILSWLGGQWSEQRAQMQPEDVLLLFSDGLLESHDEQGDELGMATLREWLAEAGPWQEPAQLIGWLTAKARQRAVDWERDDVTIVALRRVASQ